MKKEIFSLITALSIAASMEAKKPEQATMGQVQKTHKYGATKPIKAKKKESFWEFFHDGTAYSMSTEKGDFIPGYYEE